MTPSNVDTSAGPIAEAAALDACGVPVVASWPPRVAMDVAAALGAHRAGFAVDLALPADGSAPAVLRWWETDGGEIRVDRPAGELGDGDVA